MEMDVHYAWYGDDFDCASKIIAFEKLTDVRRIILLIYADYVAFVVSIQRFLSCRYFYFQL